MTSDMLSSQTISLRPPEPADLLPMYVLENDAAIWRSTGIVQPVSRSVCASYLSSVKNDIYEERQLRFAIELNQPPKTTVGFIDLFNFSPRHLRAEIGIGLLQQHRGRGYAAEAVRLLEKYAAQVLFVRQLCATVIADNQPAMKLFDKMDYKRAGVLKEWFKAKEGFADVVFFQKIL
jgi:diamine N-acetyltransferase